MPLNNRMEAWNPGEGSSLVEDAVIREFRITAADGKNCDTSHYNRSTIVQDRLFISDFDAEVMRIARNDEESGHDEGAAE